MSTTPLPGEDTTTSPWLWILLVVVLALVAGLTYLLLARRRRQEWFMRLSATADRMALVATEVPDPGATATGLGSFDAAAARASLGESAAVLEELQASAPSPELAEPVNALRACAVEASSALAGPLDAERASEVKRTLLEGVAAMRVVLAAATGEHKHAA